MAASEKLPNGNPSFYNDPHSSDVTVTFSGETFNGHAAILCRGSQHFVKALMGSFSEAQSGVVDLGDDDKPHYVHQMLRHIYGLPLEQQQEEWDSDFYFQLFAIGDKYDLPTLRDYAKGLFAGHMEGCDCIWFMSAMAEILTREWADKSLFERVTHHCARNMERLMEDEQFRSLLREVPGLAANLLGDVFANIADDPNGVMRQCGACSVVVKSNGERFVCVC